jgi:integrase
MLSDLKARKIQPGDKPISDASVRGLYLFASSTPGKGKWVLRFVSPETGKRRDMGLGTYPLVSLRDARVKAFELRQRIEVGIDPIEERRKEEEAAQKHVAIPTFEKAARILHGDLVPGFRNEKHADQWISTLEVYVFPLLGKRLVNELMPQDFANCLKPIWLSKPETASRVKQRCDAVMDWCAAQGHVMASPVSVVGKLLPKQPGKRERVVHQPAVPWRALPAFFQNVLHDGPLSVSRTLLEVLILTATRSGEVRHMTWQEIDFDHAVWTIPASRMKAKALHRVPLAPHVLHILGTLKSRAGQRPDKAFPDEATNTEKEEVNHLATGLVFPSRNGTPISDATLTKFLRDKEVASDVPSRFATAHGFRSSFRDWASEHGYGRDLAERALAHTIKNSAEAAYHRTDLLDQRRRMMEGWADHCLSSVR